MSDSMLPPEIRTLPISQRLDLVEQIWNSIVEDGDAFELTTSQQAELDRRIAAHDTAPDRGKPWEELKRRLQGE